MALNYRKVTKEEDAKRNLIDKGDYPFVVTGFSEKTSDNGNHMFIVDLQFWDINGRERQRKDWLVMIEGIEWKFRHLCDSLGIIDLYDTDQVTPRDIIGKNGVMRLGIRKNKQDGSDENHIADYLTAATMSKSKPAPAKNDAAPTADFDDDIPDFAAK